MHNKTVHTVAFLLMVVGALNWLLVGALEFNLVAMLLGGMPMIERAVYVLVGLAAIYELIMRNRSAGTGQPSPQM